MSAAEVLVESTRGGIVESVHHGALVVVDTSGDIKWSIGDAELLSFPRSSLKPFQLLALVQRGGVERFGLEQRDLAIASASHSGEEIHVDAVSRLLAKIGASQDDLRCGVHPPADEKAAQRVAKPGAVHNNCSGKHAGMLALARLLDAPLEGYLEVDHPAQRAIRETLLGVLELDPNDLPVGIDGCSAPAYAVSLRKMARGFTLLANPGAAATHWAGPLQQVSEAMRAYPELVGGTHGRADTQLMQAASGTVVAKGGAEGYFGMGHTSGQGVAFKILDGDAARRARGIVVFAAVVRLGWVPEVAIQEHGPSQPIHNWAGKLTGEARAAAVLAAGPRNR
ncbi:MAG TPA: asparaginase [Chloroflexota bacterium]|nr:asparaginase [Chloroflexota bacterium]